MTNKSNQVQFDILVGRATNIAYEVCLKTCEAGENGHPCQDAAHIHDHMKQIIKTELEFKAKYGKATK